VPWDRAVELLSQAEEMKLLRRDGELYYSSSLGNMFFEAYNNGDRAKLARAQILRKNTTS
jgi:hypothetical protein